MNLYFGTLLKILNVIPPLTFVNNSADIGVQMLRNISEKKIIKNITRIQDFDKTTLFTLTANTCSMLVIMLLRNTETIC